MLRMAFPPSLIDNWMHSSVSYTFQFMPPRSLLQFHINIPEATSSMHNIIIIVALNVYDVIMIVGSPTLPS